LLHRAPISFCYLLERPYHCRWYVSHRQRCHRGPPNPEFIVHAFCIHVNFR
jgi:hypothetical protein